MNTQAEKQSTRDPLIIGLTILVAVSLLAAVILLLLGLPTEGSSQEVTVPIATLQPGPSGEDIGSETVGEEDLTITIPSLLTAEDLDDLVMALAAVITAVTGLFGIVATQMWRRREEDRTDKSHAVTVERERLELERERLQLERERLDLERQREALLGKT